MSASSIPVDLKYVRELAYKEAALVLDETKEHMILSRLADIVQDEGFRSVDELVRALKRPTSRPLKDRVVRCLLTHETSFFRDLKPFVSLRTDILPGVIERNAGSKSLNIWSAACSTGQEPYTMAMTFREHFPQILNWDLRIIASDYSEDALSKARVGEYSRFECNRGLPATMLVKYFSRAGAKWRVKPDLAAMVQFRRQNLIESFAMLPKFDIIFLRNVLIYFDKPTKTDILKRMARQLKPGGVLAVGSSESLVFLDTPFEPERHNGCFWYRNPSA